MSGGERLHFNGRTDPLRSLTSRFFGFLSNNQQAVWTVIGVAFVSLVLYVNYIQPWLERRAKAAAEERRVALAAEQRAQHKRDDGEPVDKLRAIERLQSKHDKAAADVESYNRQVARYQRLKKLELLNQNVAGHRLGTGSEAPSKPVVMKKKPVVNRRSYNPLTGQNSGGGSWRPSSGSSSGGGGGGGG
eukprot:TRINITY_DN5348_c0_g1_i1.p1 TRINITY_DN5348_c0_g1~~TRINITY_DN5348_c0_g1_i1.p1  ORF type:complete len:189 (-),score=49.48 TRINITY_DN5348_c0_g1_i1:113-679(-)